MKRTPWIVGVRNRLSELAIDCDCQAAIEITKMTEAERQKVQNDLRKIINWIDKRVKV